VAINGHGGDFLFQVTPVYLADLLAKGRLLRLTREVRALQISVKWPRYVFEWAIQPLLPKLALSALARIRGRHLRGYFERPIPGWISADFTAKHGLRERTRLGSPRTSHGSRAAYEMYWYLTTPLYPRLNSLIAQYALEQGVEMRSPFYDRRVIEFAASRPSSERNSLGEKKILLRRAMRGLLPDDVLTPRSVKPGTLAGYFERSMKAAVPLLEETLKSPRLAELGVIDGPKLQRALGRYVRGPEQPYLREQLFFITQVESWLQAKQARSDRGAGKSVPPPVPMKNAEVESMV
jgi:asparagine synthase (glutamine-hydrolysing)